MRLRYLLALAFIGLATGCSGNGHSTSGTTGTGDQDAGSIVGKVCSIDAECVTPTQTLRCDPDRRQCICLADSDCSGSTPFCDNYTGRCVESVPGCSDQNPCTDEGTYCNPQTRSCQTIKSYCDTCKTDVECGPGNRCVIPADSTQSPFCGKGCTSDTDCPSGTACTPTDQGDSQCQPSHDRTCENFTGCVPDTLAPCDTDTDCAPTDGGVGDQVCDPTSGLCHARTQICPLGTICDPSIRVCVNSCSVDRDCSTDGSLACVNHICQALGGCQDDSTCPVDKVCSIPPGESMGSCVPTCESDASCELGQVCQAVVEANGSTRQACIPGCVQNADCPPNTVCEDENGAIFVPNGTALGSCVDTFNGAQACQSNDACQSCQACTGNICQSAASVGYCHPCDPNNATSCNAYENGGTGATCLSLAGRVNGQVVSTGPYACGVPCGESNPANPLCPKDFICAALTNADGSENGVYNCIPANLDCQVVNNASQLCH